MGWSYNFWKNNFYPKDLKPKDFLKFYSNVFDTVEINNTFYRIPNENTIVSWKNQTSNNFIFSIKVPRKITHFKMLKNTKEDTEFFLERIKALNQKLGPLLFQFPHFFTEKKIPILQNYFKILPKNLRYAIEVRNKNLVNKEFLSILKENNIALVWTNNPLLPFTDEITTDFIYIRWEGNRKKVNGSKGKTEIDQKKLLIDWANKILKCKNKTIKIFGYFSKYFSGNPTKDVKSLLEFLKNQ